MGDELMNTSGYFKIHRRIFEGELSAGPRDLFFLWIWMLSQAFFADGNRLKAGQFLTSRTEMMGILNAGRNKVTTRTLSRYIRHLTKCLRICTEYVQGSVHKNLLITVLNYKEYQEDCKPVNVGANGVNSDLTPEKLTVTPIIDKNNKKDKAPVPFFNVNKMAMGKTHWPAIAESDEWPPEKDKLIEQGAKFRYGPEDTFKIWKQFVFQREASGNKATNWIATFRNYCDGVRNKGWSVAGIDTDVKPQGTDPTAPGYDPGLLQAQAQKAIAEDNMRRYSGDEWKIKN
jgi:hypothetical protein